MNRYKRELVEITNKYGVEGNLEDALKGADVFIGVSKAGLLTKYMVESMNENPIIFAMANPVPEIMPDEAKEAGAFIVATGRSDLPNQVNNVLAFPGIFKGALKIRANRITTKMKLAAAEVLASLVEGLNVNKIIPEPLDKTIVPAVADAVITSYLNEFQ